MEAQIIGVKELHKNLKRISEAAMSGESFLIVRNSKPVFRIEPIKDTTKKKYVLRDFEKIQFRSNDKNLSKNIDKTVYDL